MPTTLITSVKQKLGAMLDVPSEIALDLPVVSMKGNNSLVVENYKGLLEFTSELVRVKAGNVTLRVTGAKLTIKTINADTLTLGGSIGTVEFLQ